MYRKILLSLPIILSATLQANQIALFMEYQAKYITDDTKLSCYEDKFFKSDISFDCHMLIWFISGQTKIVQADAIYLSLKRVISF